MQILNLPLIINQKYNQVQGPHFFWASVGILPHYIFYRPHFDLVFVTEGPSAASFWATFMSPLHQERDAALIFLVLGLVVNIGLNCNIQKISK